MARECTTRSDADIRKQRRRGRGRRRVGRADCCRARPALVKAVQLRVAETSVTLVLHEQPSTGSRISSGRERLSSKAARVGLSDRPAGGETGRGRVGLARRLVGPRAEAPAAGRGLVPLPTPTNPPRAAQRRRDATAAAAAAAAAAAGAWTGRLPQLLLRSISRQPAASDPSLGGLITPQALRPRSVLSCPGARAPQHRPAPPPPRPVTFPSVQTRSSPPFDRSAMFSSTSLSVA